VGGDYIIFLIYEYWNIPNESIGFDGWFAIVKAE